MRVERHRDRGRLLLAHPERCSAMERRKDTFPVSIQRPFWPWWEDQNLEVFASMISVTVTPVELFISSTLILWEGNVRVLAEYQSINHHGTKRETLSSRFVYLQRRSAMIKRKFSTVGGARVEVELSANAMVIGTNSKRRYYSDVQSDRNQQKYSHDS